MSAGALNDRSDVLLKQISIAHQTRGRLSDQRQKPIPRRIPFLDRQARVATLDTLCARARERDVGTEQIHELL